jgi:hypothetical protein
MPTFPKDLGPPPPLFLPGKYLPYIMGKMHQPHLDCFGFRLWMKLNSVGKFFLTFQSIFFPLIKPKPFQPTSFSFFLFLFCFVKQEQKKMLMMLPKKNNAFFFLFFFQACETNIIFLKKNL